MEGTTYSSLRKKYEAMTVEQLKLAIGELEEKTDADATPERLAARLVLGDKEPTMNTSVWKTPLRRSGDWTLSLEIERYQQMTEDELQRAVAELTPNEETPIEARIEHTIAQAVLEWRRKEFFTIEEFVDHACLKTELAWWQSDFLTVNKNYLKWEKPLDAIVSELEGSEEYQLDENSEALWRELKQSSEKRTQRHYKWFKKEYAMLEKFQRFHTRFFSEVWTNAPVVAGDEGEYFLLLNSTDFVEVEAQSFRMGVDCSVALVDESERKNSISKKELEVARKNMRAFAKEVVGQLSETKKYRLDVTSHLREKHGHLKFTPNTLHLLPKNIKQEGRDYLNVKLGNSPKAKQICDEVFKKPKKSQRREGLEEHHLGKNFEEVSISS